MINFFKSKLAEVNSTETYKAFAGYYDLYVGKFSADLNFYLSLCDKKDDILEVGCGTGRVLKKFLENNFQITGIDISEEMMEIARKKLYAFILTKNLKLHNFDLQTNRLDSAFDKVIVTFYTFNYILKQPAIFLKNIYTSTKQGGLVVLDLFYPKALIDKESDNKWFDTSININNRNIILKDNRRFDKNIEYRSQIYLENNNSLQIDTVRRYYSPTEIMNLLKQVGYKEIQFGLSYDINSFQEIIDENQLKTNYVVKAIKY